MGRGGGVYEGEMGGGERGETKKGGVDKRKGRED